MIFDYQFRNYNFRALIYMILLSVLGILVVGSASNQDRSSVIKQIIGVVVSLIICLVLSLIDYHQYFRFTTLIYVVCAGMLAAVLLFGRTTKGATRWLRIGIQFQPSEIAKAAVVIYFADSISKKKDKMRTFHYGVLPYAFILVVIGGLVAVEPHLSGAILILGAGAAMMLVGGINWAWVGAAAGAAVGLVYVALFVIGYNTSRVTYWLNPWADDPLDKGYQLRQSLITIGSGGLWGLGLGKSRQKFLFLPEEHNDFIFSIVCEELGLIGAGIIMLLFAALVLRGYWIALHCRDRFGTLLVVGFTTLMAVQVFLNIAVVSGVLPTTGISLPFFSYGGTALCVQLAEMGVILSVSRQMKPTKAG